MSFHPCISDTPQMKPIQNTEQKDGGLHSGVWDSGIAMSQQQASGKQNAIY